MKLNISKKKMQKLAEREAGPEKDWLPYERTQYIRGFVDGMNKTFKMISKRSKNN